MFEIGVLIQQKNWCPYRKSFQIREAIKYDIG